MHLNPARFARALFVCYGALAFLALWLGLPGQANAQTAARTEISINTQNPSLRVVGMKNLKIENLEGGGIRVSFRNDGGKLGWLAIEYKFEKPVTATSMSFEFRQAETEKLVALGMFDNKTVLKKALEPMGPDLFPYSVNFADLASEKGGNLVGALQSVSISFRVSPDSVERFVELKKWWVE